MRTILTPLLGLALAFGPAACGSKKPDKTDNGTGSAVVATPPPSIDAATMAGSAATPGSAAAMAGSAAGSAAVTEGSGAGSGSDGLAGPHHAGMCPSTVAGSTTKDELKGGKILVTITATDKDAITAIQTRATELIKEKADNSAPGSTSSGHDQKGTHGGGMGICPVFVPEGATAEAKNDATGVVITITPDKKAKPEEFKQIVDARIEKAAEWLKTNNKPGGKLSEEGTGGGSNHEGMNHSGKGDGKGAERRAMGQK